MKKTLLILTLTLIISQQLQSQSLFDIGSAMISSSKSSKKQKKIDRENFVIDSTRNVTETRVAFVNDSIQKVALKNQRKEETRLKELEEKRKQEWNFSECGKCKENPFTLDQTIVKYFVANVYDKENSSSFGVHRWEKDSDVYYKTKVDSAKTSMISMEVFTDSTTTTKVGTLKLTQILPTEIFVMVASKNVEMTDYKDSEKLVMIKSLKDNKIYVINDEVFNFRDYHYTSGGSVVKLYTNPQVLAQEKLAVANYKAKQKLALSTMDKMIAIQNKHIFQERNIFGQVIKEYYDASKFTKLERTTYNQLLGKLESQYEILKKEKDQKIGRRTVYDLLGDLPAGDTSFGAMQAIADACHDFKIY
jgi:hypothetical protein